MIKCAMNVMECAVAENLRHFSVLTLHAYSITVSNVGLSFTQGLDVSFISRWSKKVLIVHAVYRSDGEQGMSTNEEILNYQVFKKREVVNINIEKKRIITRFSFVKTWQQIYNSVFMEQENTDRVSCFDAIVDTTFMACYQS